MRRLADNLNSQYIASANRLKPHGARHKIVAYVESYDDVLFWRNTLQEFEDEKFYFEVMLPCRTSLAKGKKSALMNRLGNNLGTYMIACVDADYDWLMQGSTPMSRAVTQTPYVFHTYVYAIENYQCYAPCLHTACVMSTLNDRAVVDLEAFMAEYSRMVWPLFVWNVWAYRYGRNTGFCMSQFAEIVTFHDTSPYALAKLLDNLRRKVNKAVAWLQRKFPDGKKTYAPLRDSLLGMGLTPETTYLYMQGHALFDNVVMPLLNPLCTVLRREREKEIMRLAVHQTQKQNELSSYRHSQCPVDVMLKKGNGYKDYAPYQLLRDDIRRLMAELEGEK